MALVATGDTGLVGYAIWVKIYNAQAARRGIDLHHLYVSEPARRCGIGRDLVKVLVDIARDLRCGFIRIGVNPENVDAQRFYLHEGFVRQPVGGLRFRLDLQTR